MGAETALTLPRIVGHPPIKIRVVKTLPLVPSVVVDRLARRTTETTKKEAPSHACLRAKRLPCVTIVLLRRASRPIDRMVKCADRASSAGPGSLESFSSPVPVATTTLRVAVIFRSDRFLVPIRLGRPSRFLGWFDPPEERDSWFWIPSTKWGHSPMSATPQSPRNGRRTGQFRSKVAAPTKQSSCEVLSDNPRGIALRIQEPAAGRWAVGFAPTRRVVKACAVAMLLSLAAGCDEATPKHPKETNAAAVKDTKPAAAAAAAPSVSKERRDRLVDHEEWDVYYVGGAKLGYGYTRWQAVPNHPELIAAEGLLRISVKRFGEDSTSEARMSVVETAAGEVRSFASNSRLGPAPNITRGQANGRTMVVTIESGGTTRQSVMPWPRETTGYFGLEESLRGKPMQPGETRTVSTLMPILNQIASVELRALKTESTALLAGSRDLLRIESTTKLPAAQPIEGVLWTDDQGNTLKSLSAALDQISYRTTKEFALRESTAPALDLGTTALVRLAQPLTDPHLRSRSHIASIWRIVIQPRRFSRTRAKASPRSTRTRPRSWCGPCVPTRTRARRNRRAMAPRAMIESQAATFRATNRKLSQWRASSRKRSRPLANGRGASSDTFTRRSRRRTTPKRSPPQPKSPRPWREIAPSTPCCWRRCCVPRHSGTRGHRAGVRTFGAGLCLSHVDRSLDHERVDRARRYPGPGGHRRRPPETGHIELERRVRLFELSSHRASAGQAENRSHRASPIWP